MSKHAAYSPKHRGVAERPLTEVPRKAVKATLLLSALAVAGTGTAVGGGIALTSSHSSQPDQVTEAAAALPQQQSVQSGSAGMAARRQTSLSRSDSREDLDPTKAASLGALAGKDTSVVTRTESMSGADPQSIASALLSSYGWSGSQFGCLVSLWDKESGWNPHAENASSGAYGIPQALPGSKMASAGSDWQTNPETQIRWGLGYIEDRYGSPCGAWGHSESYGWY